MPRSASKNKLWTFLQRGYPRRTIVSYRFLINFSDSFGDQFDIGGSFIRFFFERIILHVLLLLLDLFFFCTISILSIQFLYNCFFHCLSDPVYESEVELLIIYFFILFFIRRYQNIVNYYINRRRPLSITRIVIVLRVLLFSHNFRHYECVCVCVCSAIIVRHRFHNPKSCKIILFENK